MTDLDYLPDGLNTLFRIAFTYYTLPAKSSGLLDYVKMKLIEHFTEYDLAMTEIH